MLYETRFPNSLPHTVMAPGLQPGIDVGHKIADSVLSPEPALWPLNRLQDERIVILGFLSGAAGQNKWTYKWTR